jgi:hypothetical protein
MDQVKSNCFFAYTVLNNIEDMTTCPSLTQPHSMTTIYLLPSSIYLFALSTVIAYVCLRRGAAGVF